MGQLSSRTTSSSALSKSLPCGMGLCYCTDAKKSARKHEGDPMCPGQWPYERCGDGWSPGSCCGAIGERGQSSPHLLCCNACLNSLGVDRGSFSMARSDCCYALCFVSSLQHGSPGSWWPSSPACRVRFPRSDSARPG